MRLFKARNSYCDKEFSVSGPAYWKSGTVMDVSRFKKYRRLERDMTTKARDVYGNFAEGIQRFEIFDVAVPGLRWKVGGRNENSCPIVIAHGLCLGYRLSLCQEALFSGEIDPITSRVTYCCLKAGPWKGGFINQPTRNEKRTSADNQLRLLVYPIIFRVLYIRGGAGFLNHQQYQFGTQDASHHQDYRTICSRESQVLNLHL